MTLGPWYVGDTPTTTIEVRIQRDGEPVDLSGFVSASVLLFNADATLTDWDGITTIDVPNNAVNIPPPASSPFPTSGLYSLYLRLQTSSGSFETFFVEFVRVAALGGAPGWTSVARVRSITGVTVTDDQLSEAQGVIELYSGRTFESTNNSRHPIRDRDKVWLEKAVAYQAAWQITQPGYLGRHGIKEVNQDGAQIIYAGGSEPNNTALIMLAPLARRSLKNVSWMRTRSIRVRRPKETDDELYYGDWKTNDDHPGWRPL